jgi:hypothetical protein
MKGDGDPDGLAEECDDGDRDCERKQAPRRPFARPLPPGEQPIGDQSEKQVGTVTALVCWKYARAGRARPAMGASWRESHAQHSLSNNRPQISAVCS